MEMDFTIPSFSVLPISGDEIPFFYLEFRLSQDIEHDLSLYLAFRLSSETERTLLALSMSLEIVDDLLLYIALRLSLET